MNNYFQDIVEKLGKPKWFDDLGYPRYCDFSPDEVSNIYSTEVILLLIACQNCGTLFKVALNTSGYNLRTGQFHSFKEWILDKSVYYGDPPNMQCCGAGPSMSSDSIKVLEFWEKSNDRPWDWTRNSKYEIDLYDYEGKI